MDLFWHSRMVVYNGNADTFFKAAHKRARSCAACWWFSLIGNDKRTYNRLKRTKLKETLHGMTDEEHVQQRVALPHYNLCASLSLHHYYDAARV